MSAWFRGIKDPASASGAPPEGVSGSEQSVENDMWRVQLDLATGGVRSLLLRGQKRDLVEPEAAIHPFQGVLRDPAGVLVAASRYVRARFRFDEAGASLAVESSLAGGVWKSMFRVKAGDPILGVDLEWARLAPGMNLELALPFVATDEVGIVWLADGADGMRMEGRDFHVTVAGRGATWRPERSVAELSGAVGSMHIALRAF